jgi:hypothetical protein
LDSYPVELLIELLERPLIARYVAHVRLGGNTPDEDLDEDFRLRRELIRGKPREDGKLMLLLKSSRYLRETQQDLNGWDDAILATGNK